MLKKALTSRFGLGWNFSLEKRVVLTLYLQKSFIFIDLRIMQCMLLSMILSLFCW